MERRETECVVRHAAGKRRLAEIGVWEGGSTRILRQAMAPDATLFGIDPHPSGRLGLSYARMIAAGEAAHSRNGSVEWLRMKGVDAARDPRVLAAPFDFVLIDGDHSYEGLREDWEAWSPLVAPGGIVALHDSVNADGRSTAGSVDFSTSVIVHDPRFVPVENAGTLRVLRREGQPPA